MDPVDEILDVIDVMTAGDHEYFDTLLFDGFTVEEDDLGGISNSGKAILYQDEYFPISQMRIDRESNVWIPKWLYDEKY